MDNKTINMKEFKKETTDINRVALNDTPDNSKKEFEVPLNTNSPDFKIQVLNMVMSKIDRDGIKINDSNFTNMLIDNSSRIHEFIISSKPLPSLFDSMEN